MATLRHRDHDTRHTLSARNLVGRSRRAALTLPDAAISAEHATLWWTGESWRLRDLGSRNGTLHNDRRLDPGETVTLAPGDHLTFGRPAHTWIVADLDPPVAFAVPPDGGSPVFAVDGALALPPGDDAEAIVTVAPDGEWYVETERGVEAIDDLTTLTLSSGGWRLHLPEALPGTAAATTLDASAEPALHFRVSLDEEHVELTCTLGPHRIDLGARAHHYLLLTLARARLRDADDPALPDSARGWLHVEDLTRMLDAEETHLNVQVFRARKAFVQAGAGAAPLIERRARSAQLRLGVRRLTITAI